MKTCRTANLNKATETHSAWEIWRHEGIDAEDAATLSGENPWESPETLLARKAQLLPTRKPVTEAMILGRENRPKALEAYRTAVGIKTLRPANLELISDPRLIAHPDLLCFQPLHIAEVHSGESALKKAQAMGKIPKPYWAEAQHTLMVSGLKFLKVFFYSPNAKYASKTFTVSASEGFQKELRAEELRFLANIKSKREEIAAKSRISQEAAALEATIAAIKGKGPKVPLETFRKFVPQFLTRKGEPTPAGQTLLASLSN